MSVCSGFWHMELDEESSDLTTFMTPFGRYKFKRAPFSLCCTPEMFQYKMVQIFGDIPGVMVYFDDVCIAAENETEHDGKSWLLSWNVLGQMESDLTLKKSSIKNPKSMGNILSKGEIKPRNKHLDAILKTKKPKNKHQVMRLSGLFKYLAKFLPNLSKLIANLRMLTHDKVEFNFTQEHEKELDNLLGIITSGPVLATYDPKLPVVIQTDASKDGLGSVVMQNGHPVAFASRTLSDTEQSWAQIEKELLAIVFACNKFDNFVYRREFIV